MKKVLLVGINTKYIHTNLALLYLSGVARGRNIDFETAEYTINQSVDSIMQDIYSKKVDIVLFSCYLWNIEYVRDICEDLYKIDKKIEIYLGGPEVTFDPKQTLELMPSVKAILLGEGEETLSELIEVWEEKRDSINSVAGIYYREDNIIKATKIRLPMNIDKVIFPYDKNKINELRNKIVYYESSRGCPFRCSYCLSSVDKVLRFRSMDLVKKELKIFLDASVSQVKFIDRTFNCRHDRTKEIFKFLLDNDNGITNFHFEVAADLLDEEEIYLLSKMRAGYIQLEIGIQSIQEDTLKAINRTMDIEKIKKIMSSLNKANNIHLHLDLIIGLPYEDMNKFRESFNYVYNMEPSQLQVGFLKVLKGTQMMQRKEEFGIIYHKKAPYEVMSTKYISYDEIIFLKAFEEMVEVYYNSAQFIKTLEFLESLFSDRFSLYEELARYYIDNDLLELKHTRVARYSFILDFIKEKFSIYEDKIKDLLVFDLYARENLKSRPDFAKDESSYSKEFISFFDKEDIERKYLNSNIYKDKTKSQLKRMTHFENLSLYNKGDWENKWYLFDYSDKSPISGNVKVFEVDI